MQRFTGAAVQLRTAAGLVPGGSLPALDAAAVPTGTTLRHAGRTYEVVSFAARAFPSGPLRVSLLVAA
jgi:IS4 transposase